MPDESTPTCQRYLCKNPTTRITGVVSKKDEVWVISTCDEHNPLKQGLPNKQADMTCECCGQERTSLPFHSDRYGVTYCQECYDTGCSIGSGECDL